MGTCIPLAYSLLAFEPLLVRYHIEIPKRLHLMLAFLSHRGQSSGPPYGACIGNLL